MLMFPSRTDVVQPARIERQHLIDGAPVLHARDRVALVVIHVAGGDDQHALVSLRQHIGDRDAQCAQHLEVAGADGDGNELEIPERALAEMAAAPPARARSDAPPRLRTATACAPSTRWRALRAMGASPSGVCQAPRLMIASGSPMPVWFGHRMMHALRQFQPPIHRSRNVPGVHVAGVRDNAAQSANFRLGVVHQGGVM